MKNPLEFERSLRTVVTRLLEITLSAQTLEQKLGAALQSIFTIKTMQSANQGAIFLADDAKCLLTLAAGHHLPPEIEQSCATVPYGYCICGRVSKERQIIYMEHQGHLHDRHGHFCAPIQAGEQLLGVLNIYTAPEHQRSEEVEHSLAAVSGILALLIVHHRHDQELAERSGLLANILDHVPFRVFWKDRHSVYQGCNRQFALDLGVADPVEIIGRQDEDLPGRQREAATFLRRDQLVMESNQPLLNYEEIRCLTDGREVMVMASLLPLVDGSGNASGVLGIYADVTTERETEIRFRNLSLSDQLTGLPNQALFNDRLQQAIHVGQRTQEVLGVISLDIDNFKKINHTLSHAAGDEVLRQVATRLKQAVREDDTVGRMGGDSFNLLLSHLTQEEDVSQVVRKLRKLFLKPFYVDNQELYVTATVGVTLFPRDGDNAGDLLRNAATARHRAKEKGSGGYELYSPSMNSSALMRLSLESQLHKALELQQFEIYYQPQVDAGSGCLVGVEALVRWRHPDLGLIAPPDFISLAEETGAIVEIGAWVLNEVCRHARLWQDRGLALKRVAVNLSSRQFQHHDLVTTVCAALLDSGLKPGLLELEITETAVMHDIEQAAGVLNYFREMGVQIAIDDFGTGYSSLSLLKKFPITLLKIDRSFIKRIGDDQDYEAIVTAIVAMARQLKMKSLAEGVETMDQWKFLRDSGCDELQGFLFGRPMELAGFEALLASAGVHSCIIPAGPP